ncbi:MAG: hypothetical protein WC700_07635 [Gemmatimonadaceae bacterium]
MSDDEVEFIGDECYTCYAQANSDGALWLGPPLSAAEGPRPGDDDEPPAPDWHDRDGAVLVLVPRSELAEIPRWPLTRFAGFQHVQTSFADGSFLDVPGYCPESFVGIADAPHGSVWESPAYPGFLVVNFEPLAYETFVTRTLPPHFVPWWFLVAVYDSHGDSLPDSKEKAVDRIVNRAMRPAMAPVAPELVQSVLSTRLVRVYELQAAQPIPPTELPLQRIGGVHLCRRRIEKSGETVRLRATITPQLRSKDALQHIFNGYCRWCVLLGYRSGESFHPARRRSRCSPDCSDHERPFVSTTHSEADLAASVQALIADMRAEIDHLNSLISDASLLCKCGSWAPDDTRVTLIEPSIGHHFE